MNQSSVVAIMMTIILLSTPLHSLASTARHQGTLTLGDVETMLRLVLKRQTARRQSPSWRLEAGYLKATVVHIFL